MVDIVCYDMFASNIIAQIIENLHDFNRTQNSELRSLFNIKYEELAIQYLSKTLHLTKAEN